MARDGQGWRGMACPNLPGARWQGTDAQLTQHLQCLQPAPDFSRLSFKWSRLPSEWDTMDILEQGAWQGCLSKTSGISVY